MHGSFMRSFGKMALTGNPVSAIILIQRRIRTFFAFSHKPSGAENTGT